LEIDRFNRLMVLLVLAIIYSGILALGQGMPAGAL
jgi:hypothetical protein